MLKKTALGGVHKLHSQYKGMGVSQISTLENKPYIVKVAMKEEGQKFQKNGYIVCVCNNI